MLTFHGSFLRNGRVIAQSVKSVCAPLRAPWCPKLFFFQKFLQNHKIYYLRTLQLNLQSPRTIMIFYSILSSVLIRNGVGGTLESSEGQYMITVTKKKIKKIGKKIQYDLVKIQYDLVKIQYDLINFLIW